MFFSSLVSAQESKNADPLSSDLNLSDSVPADANPSASQNFFGPAEQNLVLDLGDCVRMALRNNSEIKESALDIELSQWRLKEAQPSGLPVIDYEYEAAPVPMDASNAVDTFFKGDITMINRVKVGIGVPVFTFGKIKLAQSLARMGIGASQEKKTQKTNEIVLKVKQLYNGILLAADVREMLEEALKKINEEINKREAEAGGADPLELAKIKLTRFEVLKHLGETIRKGELAVAGLRLQIGMDRNFSYQIKDQHLRPVDFQLKDLDFYLQESKRYRPESRLLDIAVKAKETEYRLEKRKLLPNLGVGMFYELGSTVDTVANVGSTSDFNDPFNYTRAGVGIRIKGDLNFTEARAKIKQKQLEYYKVSALKDYAEDGLNLDMQDAYSNAKQSKIDLENMEQAYRLARQVVFLSKTNNDIGVGDKNAYGEALQSYLLMKGRYFEAIFNYNNAVATLMSKIGYQY
ncbi:MAG: TolC family protein [Deltaproteobacteria bacterium]|nr:TolC family protein [Deltaproteobacteria bacterium]